MRPLFGIAVLATALGLAAGGCSGSPTSDVASTATAADAPATATAAPTVAYPPPLLDPSDHLYFGVNLQWGEDSPAAYAARTGLKPEVDLTHEDVNRFISRRHAKIIFKNETFYLVEEVGVTNGTYLNGKRLQAGVFTPIQFGDELCFGKVFMVFDKPAD